MNVHKAPWVVALAVLAVAVGLPLAAHWLRGPPPPGCTLDGATIDPAYRVTVVDAGGQPHSFCCIRCAQLWLAGQPPPRSVSVTDEAGGGEIDAASAYYVRSQVVTTPAVGNRIHAFLRLGDAEQHADRHGGTVLTGAERPFWMGRSN
jgi:hypothetical protein